MAITLTAETLQLYCNETYAAQGGYARFTKMVDDLKWPKSQIAKELNISRPWLNKLIALHGARKSEAK